MFIVTSLSLALACCVITMLGWGSWANTQKLAGKTEWPFELYYWDYALGLFLFSILFMFTLGNHGAVGMGAIENLRSAASGNILRAMASGIIFNVSNILLVVAIDTAGMSVALPIGVGLALVIGTVESYLQAPKGNPVALFAGVAFVVLAMITSAIAHSKLPRVPGRPWLRGVIFAVIAGCLMGFFYPQLVSAITPNFNAGVVESGFLTPYTSLFFFAVGLLLSNIIVNTVFMKAGGKTYGEYFKGTLQLHTLGIVGGIIWMLALSLNVIASGVAGPAISYSLGQGATLVAALWGILVWKEFRAAPPGTTPFIYIMLLGYTVGLTLIGLATL